MFADYQATMSKLSLFDEMVEAQTGARGHYSKYQQFLDKQTAEYFQIKKQEADLLFHRVGITFNVYGENEGTERLIPFDPVPRIIPASEWRMLEQGIKQRVNALNHFLYDIYHEQHILKAGIIPAEQVLANAQYQPCMQGINLHRNTYAHITGVDLIRNEDGQYYVLEDNLRTPSGVSYMIENRKIMMRLFPELFSRYPIAPVDHYPALLHRTLKQSADKDNPTVAVLTPGRYNSAYFEHAFLAQQMGVELVEGQDLLVKNNRVYMRTTHGHQQVDVIYRRIDDAYLDPLTFMPDSTLGVAGLTSVYRAGNVVIANAIGTGVADDKSIYPYVPQMIEFYLSEKAILHNVPTWQCRNSEDLKYTLDHLSELVVKEVHGAGGYGMLIGPKATKTQIKEFRAQLLANPSNYIAQPTLSLSTCPTFIEEGLAPRHIDLRPFLLTGETTQLVAGGLTRVALKAGSLVVNSSQGGGTKDTLGIGGCAMLSRTAGELYWMARYLERAENTSRLLEVAMGLSMLPAEIIAREELTTPLIVTGSYGEFTQTHPVLDYPNVFQFLSLDPLNTNSIATCLSNARDNARSVRGKISTDTWEVINSNWLTLQQFKRRKAPLDANTFLDWVKERGHLFRGAMFASSLRNEAYAFIRVGIFIERALHITQVLTHRFELIKDDQDLQKSSPNSAETIVRLHAVLRSFGAYEMYQHHFDQVNAHEFAQLMILNTNLPRSIFSCLNELSQTLNYIQGGLSLASRRKTAINLARVQYADTRYIFEERGIYRYLSDLFTQINDIADSIHADYLEIL